MTSNYDKGKHDQSKKGPELMEPRTYNQSKCEDPLLAKVTIDGRLNKKGTPHLDANR